MGDFLSASAAAIYAIISLNVWGAIILWKKIPVPKLKFKLGDNTVEVLDAQSKPSAVQVTPTLAPPVPEVGTPVTDQAAAEVVPQKSDDLEADPFFQLFEASDKGLWSLKSTWESLRSKIGLLEESRREMIEVYYHGQRIAHGETDAVADLVALADAHPSWRRPTVRLAEHFLEIGRTEEAEKWARTSIDRAVLKREHTRAYAILIEAHQERSDAVEIEQLAQSLLANCNVAQSRASVCEAVAKIFVERSDKDAAAYWYERAVAERPEDVDVRFNAAYELSRIGAYPQLTYFHYRALEKTSPSRTFVLNNLAYSAERLGEEVLLGDYLERAILVDKEWATANKAIKLAAGGFVDNASELLNSLGAEHAGHERVVEVRKYIESVKKSQTDARKSLDDAASTLAKFLRIAVSADISKVENRLEASYTAQQTTLRFSIAEDKKLTAELHFEGTTFAGKLSKGRFGYRGELRVDADTAAKRTLLTMGPDRKTLQVRRTNQSAAIALVGDPGEGADYGGNYKFLDLSVSGNTLSS